MEPYSPEFRRFLKEAHPGLRDADIDLLQELTTRRIRVLPEADSNLIQSLDRQITELKQTRMPNFDLVAREYAAIQRAEQAVREAPRVVIRPKR